MSNASIVNCVVEQLVIDDLIVVKTNGKLTKHSAQTLGAAATSLALVMKKDRRPMFFYIRRLALRKAKAMASAMRPYTGHDKGHKAYAKALAIK